MSEKYYLLTFNDDYGDEHNVPALACMNEEEYKKWLETPSGDINKKYDESLKKFKEQEEDNKSFWKMLEDKGYTLNGSGNTGCIPKTDLETLKLEKEYRERHSYHNRIEYPNKVHSRMNAYLGNGGDCFEQNYSNYYLMKEFVDNKIVSVLEVDKSFYDVFHKAGLNHLSLCNVFTINE